MFKMMTFSLNMTAGYETAVHEVLDIWWLIGIENFLMSSIVSMVKEKHRDVNHVT